MSGVAPAKRVLKKGSVKRRRPSIQGTEIPMCAPQCTGWFDSLLGHCLNVGPTATEEREEGQISLAVQSKEATEAQVLAEGLIAMGLGLRSPRDKATYKAARHRAAYLVDNSLLQIQGRPGVGYRYSKCDADRVDRERSPALWGDVVHGVDQGDGWLKVDQFYLPMGFQGMPVLTRISPVVEEMALPALYASSEGEAEEEEAAGPVHLSDPLLPKEALACCRRFATLVEQRRSPAALSEHAVAAPCFARPRRAPEAPLVAPEPTPWQLRPSVGTWLRRLPRQEAFRPAVAEAAAEEEEAAAEPAVGEALVETSWRQLPSVGTWLLLPRHTTSEAAATIGDEACIEVQSLQQIEVDAAELSEEDEVAQPPLVAAEEEVDKASVAEANRAAWDACRAYRLRQGPCSPTAGELSEEEEEEAPQLPLVAAEEEVDEVPELPLFAEVAGKRPLVSKLGDDCDTSPSTCAPDTPMSYMDTPTSSYAPTPLGAAVGHFQEAMVN